MIFAGYDEGVGPSVYLMDYLSSCVKVPFAIHGYGSYFGLSICDKYYKKDMNEQEAVALLNRIVAELQKRFLVNMPTFHVRIVDQKGIRDLPTIHARAAPTHVHTGGVEQSMDI
jgi:20S proteasome subunit beta 4